MAKYSDVRNIRVLAFLDAYEKQECLWDPSLESYKNKGDRDQAYLEIIKELNIPSLTVHDVKLKVKGIRTTYTKELRVLNKYKEEGKAYTPKLFWFNKANGFLKNVCVSRPKKEFPVKRGEIEDLKNFNIEYGSENYTGDELNENESMEETHISMLEQEGTASHTDYKNIIKVVEEVDAQMVNQDQDTSMQQFHLESPFIEAQESNQNETNNTPTDTSKVVEDEYDLFCRSVASQLRSITDTYSRALAKLKIQQILFEAETGHYKNTPCITIPIVQQINNM